MVMKKAKTLVLIMAIMLLALSACNSSGSKSPNNSIMLSNLSAEQKELINLISSHQEVLIFDFSTDESFRGFELWVEVYKNGGLIVRPAGISTYTDTTTKRNGRCAITISLYNSTYQWALTAEENGGHASHIGTWAFTDDSGFGRVYGSLNEPASIEDGKEIIIYSSAFLDSNSPIHAAYDTQTLQEQPELLNHYNYVHLIKVKFTS
jgi:hypothetical protein